MLIRPIHHELELWKWLAIISVAVALAMAFATTIAAAHAPSKVKGVQLAPLAPVSNAQQAGR